MGSEYTQQSHRVCPAGEPNGQPKARFQERGVEGQLAGLF